MKLGAVAEKQTSMKCFKASKTLSGIETGLDDALAAICSGFKASKTLSGIETWIGLQCLAAQLRFKASKTLSGIETFGGGAVLYAKGKIELQSL